MNFHKRDKKIIFKKLKYFFLIGFALFISALTKAQTGISGTVLEANTNSALEGVTVKVKGTDKVTTTDKNGNFNINGVANSVTLVFSHVGHVTKETEASNRSTLLKILLEVVLNNLEDVTVSTGYQSLPKERATGSFTIVNNALFNRSVSTDIISRLDGVTNGVLFDKRGSSPAINIRGLSTIYANSTPLIVIDDFPYEGDIKNINPNDVENITILKDAAAASIWGVRAANAVIVITTKKAHYNQRQQIDVNTSITSEKKPDLFYLPTISSSDFIDAEEFLFAKGYYKNQENNTTHPVLSPVVELLIKKRDGTLPATDADNQINALRNIDVRNDFEKYVYQNSLKQQYSVNMRGCNNVIAYALSAGHDRNIDQLAAKYNRTNIRFDNTITISPLFEWNTSVAFTQSESKTGKPGYNTVTSSGGKDLYPYAQLADENGQPLAIVKDYRTTFIQQAETKGLLNWQYVPLDDYKYNDNTTKLTDLVLKAGLTARISRHFSALLKYQYESSLTINRNLQTQDAYYTRDIINRYSQVDAVGGITYPVPQGAILGDGTTTLTSHAARAQVNYNNNWKENEITVIAGGEYRTDLTSYKVNRTYGFDDDILVYTDVDFANSYRLYNNNRLSQIPDTKSFSEQLNRYITAYFNASYTYNNKYTFSASARRDGSNLFGVKTNQKFVPLWSSGLAWNISREKFYKSELFPYVKLRVTYGYNGNVDNTRSAFSTVRYSTASGSNLYINAPYAYLTSLPDQNLRWETVGIINLGADFETKKRILSGSLEFYHKNAKDLLAEAVVDPTVGYLNGKVFRNVANMSASGIDIQITSLNFNKAFKWSTNLIFDYNNNKITNFDTTSTIGSNYVSSGATIVPITGKPLYSIFSYRFGGLNNTDGNPIGYLNGKQTTDYSAINYETPVSDLVYSGPALPTVFGSVRNTFSYKSFELSFNITYRLGYYFRQSSINYASLLNNWRGNNDFSKRWQKPGDETTTHVPSMIYPLDNNRETFYTYSDILVHKADNIRFQDVSLNYTFIRNNRHLKPFNSIQVYGYINNIGILWRANKIGVDPDYQVTLPPSRSFSVGLRTSL